jgi:hypothetical protein
MEDSAHAKSETYPIGEKVLLVAVPEESEL